LTDPADRNTLADGSTFDGPGSREAPERSARRPAPIYDLLVFPIDRQAGPRIRVAPNTTMFAYGQWDEHFGELVQRLYEVGADEGITIEFDADQHPRRGEARAGAAPLEALRIAIEALAAFEGLARLAELVLHEVVPWIRKHRGDSPEEVSVEIVGPNGEVLKSVLVDPDGETREWPPR